MNIERLLDTISNANDTRNSLYHASALYRKAHGHGVYFYNGKKLSEEEARIDYLSREDNAESDKVWTLFYVLDFTPEQRERAYTAARALRRWYDSTEWQFCPTSAILSQLRDFVIG